MLFIDTHTHIYTEEFAADRDEVVARAEAAGAVSLLLPCIDEDSISPMLQLCKAHPRLCCPMMGLHPTELPADPTPTLLRMEQRLADPGNPYIAVGETGIDLYWDASRREEQIAVFRRHAEWAVRFGLPLVVHSRSAHRETTDTLLPFASSRLSGVFHCFGGNAEEAAELLRLFPNFCLGIGGIATFRKSSLPATLAASVPLSRIVVETDAPYLAPVPHRGQRNEPAYVPFIIQAIARAYSLSPEETAEALLENTLRLFPKIASTATASHHVGQKD